MVLFGGKIIKNALVVVLEKSRELNCRVRKTLETFRFNDKNKYMYSDFPEKDNERAL